MFPFGETVTVLTAGTTTDPYSTESTDDWTNPTSLEVPGVAVEPKPTGEPLEDARHRVVSGYTLYFPADVFPTPQQRVVVRGATYEIDGESAVWRSPFTGWTPGNVVQTKREVG
jgi:hypothetical protein